MNKTLKLAICTGIWTILVLTTQNAYTAAITSNRFGDDIKLQVNEFSSSLSDMREDQIEKTAVELCRKYNKGICEIETVYSKISEIYILNPSKYGPIIAANTPQINHPVGSNYNNVLKGIQSNKVMASSESALAQQSIMCTLGFLDALAIYRSHWDSAKIRNGLMLRRTGDDKNKQEQYKAGWSSFCGTEHMF